MAIGQGFITKCIITPGVIISYIQQIANKNKWDQVCIFKIENRVRDL